MGYWKQDEGMVELSSDFVLEAARRFKRYNIINNVDNVLKRAKEKVKKNEKRHWLFKRRNFDLKKAFTEEKYGVGNVNTIFIPGLYWRNKCDEVIVILRDRIKRPKTIWVSLEFASILMKVM